MPKANAGAGDLLVTVDVVVPQTLSDEQRQVVEALAATEPANPRSHLGRLTFAYHSMSAGGFDERALYVISVAAELAGVHPQTLRIDERRGLVEPQRTVGLEPCRTSIATSTASSGSRS